MKCTNCGNEVPNTAKVCGHCGHRLKEAVQSAPISTPRPGASGWWRWAVLGGVAVIIVCALSVGAAMLLVRRGFVKVDLGNNPGVTQPPQINPTATVAFQEARPTATAAQKPENTAVSIIVEPFQGGETATKLSDLATESSPGKWSVNISSKTPVLINWGWCTARQETLDQNLQHMQIMFYVDGIDVTSSMSQSLGKIEGGVCRYYRGVIRSWPTGQHVILYKMIFLQKVNDGEKDYEGENTKTYTINISP